MIENVVRSVGGVAMFGIFSICLFFAFFIGMAIWASRLKKNYLNSMEVLPLEDGTSKKSTESRHE
jgi:cytochrome c oxidase cbb3-type subunit IV